MEVIKGRRKGDEQRELLIDTDLTVGKDKDEWE